MSLVDVEEVVAVNNELRITPAHVLTQLLRSHPDHRVCCHVQIVEMLHVCQHIIETFPVRVWRKQGGRVTRKILVEEQGLRMNVVG